LSQPAGHRWRAALTGFLLGFAQFAIGEPWAPPGDEALRSDIQLLADSGILRGPITTWPISWPDVARDVLAADLADFDDSTQRALLRVKRRAHHAAARGWEGLALRASLGEPASPMRVFGASPREEGELEARATWLGQFVAVNAQVTAVAEPQDGRRFRPDGSYVGVNVGNFMISAGYMERWWGPGWDGSLILSTNARPIPSFTVERNYTEPFRSALLSWLGPWRASLALGRAEGRGVPVEGVRFLAARVNFRPRPWLELALSRTAQWCGGTQDCNLTTFANLLAGRDNRDASLSFEEEPGNQLAGYDLRLRSPWRELPLAVYTQWIGEDEAGGLPSKFMGLMGLETWFSSDLGSWRLRGEYADTTCTFTREDPAFDTCYRHSRYTQGYRYRGRIIGHSMDNDSRMTSLAASWHRPRGDLVSLLARRIDSNRDGGEHLNGPAPMEIHHVELRYSREFAFGRVGIGAGWEERTTLLESAANFRGFVTWQQGLR
jgi:hypothetical protein